MGDGFKMAIFLVLFMALGVAMALLAGYVTAQSGGAPYSKKGDKGAKMSHFIKI